MAYLYQRKDGRTEIREARSTPRGPRSHTLASFTGPLREAHLARAAAAALRPFDPDRIRERASQLGIAVAQADANSSARALIAALRGGASLDPVLAGVLGAQLQTQAREPVPEALSDAEEWIGAGEAERGRALRDVLRLYGRISASPDAPPPPPRVQRARIAIASKPASA